MVNVSCNRNTIYIHDSFYPLCLFSKNKYNCLMLVFRAATVHIPKPPPNKTAKAIQARRDHRRQVEAEVRNITISTILTS